MIGRSEEVRRENEQILRAILSDNQYEIVPQKWQEDQDKLVLKEAKDEGDKINVDGNDVGKVDLEESEVKVVTEARDTKDPVKWK